MTRQPPSELPETAKTQSAECFLHTTVLRAYVGEQAAYVYSCVYSQRGITLGDLRTKSGLPLGPLKKILVTLIQLGCVVYVRPNSNRERPVKYMVNEEGCWKLTYVDECVRHIREKFGSLHAEVMQNVVLRGHVTVGAYVKDMTLASEVEKIEHAFVELVEDKWLVPVKEMDFVPMYKNFGDCIKQANREFLINSGQYARMDEESNGGGNSRFKSVGMSQLKKTTLIKDLAKEKFMRLYNDQSGKDELFKAGIHRQGAASASSSASAIAVAKAATNASNTTTDPGLAVAKGISTLFSDDEEEDVDGDGNVDINGSGAGSKYLKRVNGNVALSFSLERLLKHERSLTLASICKHRIGNITAKIYAVALGRIERSSRDVRSVEDAVDKLVADASVGAGSAGSSTSGYDPLIGEELRKRMELDDQQKGLSFGAVDILKELSHARGGKYGLTKDDLIGTICEDEDDEEGREFRERERKRKLEGDASGGGSNKRSKLNKVVSPFDDDDDDDDDEEDNGAGETGFELTNSSENSEVLKLILQHLKLLTTDKQLSFLVETSPGQFYVPFSVLFGTGGGNSSSCGASQVTQYHMKQVIRNVLGQGALRVLNCIERQRLVEEKNIAKSVLMREGDVRRTVATLLRFALVEIQEIPRTADRAAMRSIFAFRVNRKYAIARATMRRCLVHGMASVLDGVEKARLGNKMLLDKVSRADVRGHEGELLLAGELAQLRAVVEGERRALAQLQRLRTLAGVLQFM